MIENLGYNIRIEQLDAAVKEIISVYNQNDWTQDHHLTSLFKSLDTYGKVLSLSINKAEIGLELEERVMARCKKFDALNALLTGYAHHPDKCVKNAAYKIKAIVDLHVGTIKNKNCYAGSNYIKSMLKDFVKPSIVSLMDPLPGVIDLCDELYAAQIEFKETQKTYEGKLAEESWDDLSRIKNIIVNLIDYKLVVYLKAMVQVDEIHYADIALKIGQIIATARNNRLITPVEEPEHCEVALVL